MKRLRILYAFGYCGIDYKGIKDLNLKKETRRGWLLNNRRMFVVDLKYHEINF